MNNIVIDAMGGDNAPAEIVKGAVLACGKAKILLVGKQEQIEAELKKYSYDKNSIEIINATEVIGNDEVPTVAMRTKKDSSMMVGINLLKEGKADAMISAGSTGAYLAATTLKIGRIEGIKRPALGALLPTAKGHTLLLDCGANVDCKAEYLLQFGIMGSVYMESVLGIKNPKIALANIGAEKEKGNALTKEASKLLEESKLNFTYNIEARDISTGEVDVVVCDGFVGNVILKSIEGYSKFLLSSIKQEIMSSTKSKIGGLLAKGAFANVRKKFDHSEVGGAPFLGLKSLVIKTHGSAKAKDIVGSVSQANKFIDNNLIKRIEENIWN